MWFSPWYALQGDAWVSGCLAEQSNTWFITVIAGGGQLIKISQAGCVILSLFSGLILTGDE